jgi:hypothetical protein
VLVHSNGRSGYAENFAPVQVSRKSEVGKIVDVLVAAEADGTLIGTPA